MVQKSPQYGTIPSYIPPPRQGVNLGAMFITLVMPWLLFIILFWVLSFEPHAFQPSACNMVVLIILSVVIALGLSAYQAAVRARQGVGEPPSWSILLFVCGIIAFSAGFIGGNSNFNVNMRPYYDIMALNVYPSVDPSAWSGKSFMDAGRIDFLSGATLDLSKNMGFMDSDMYCVAPIIMKNKTMESYDFWAVGTNCCSGQQKNYRCGEYNNVLANSGLRLMKDHMRPFFRLAVQQAEATYNIKAQHPIFFYWMQDPSAEITAYRNSGYKGFALAVSCFFAFQLFFVIVAAIIFSLRDYRDTTTSYKTVV